MGQSMYFIFNVKDKNYSDEKFEKLLSYLKENKFNVEKKEGYYNVSNKYFDFLLNVNNKSGFEEIFFGVSYRFITTDETNPKNEKENSKFLIKLSVKIIELFDPYHGYGSNEYISGYYEESKGIEYYSLFGWLTYFNPEIAKSKIKPKINSLIFYKKIDLKNGGIIILHTPDPSSFGDGGPQIVLNKLKLGFKLAINEEEALKKYGLDEIKRVEKKQRKEWDEYGS